MDSVIPFSFVAFVTLNFSVAVKYQGTTLISNIKILILLAWPKIILIFLKYRDKRKVFYLIL